MMMENVVLNGPNLWELSIQFYRISMVIDHFL